MIIDSIINFAKNVVLWFIGLLPDAQSLSSPDWSQYLSNANLFVNMPLLLSIAGIFVTYEMAILGVRIVIWIWGLIKP